MNKTARCLIRPLALLLALLVLAGCTGAGTPTTAPPTTAPITTAPTVTGPSGVASLEEIPPFAGYPYVVVNGNLPDFTEAELAAAAESYEFFSELDALGRCGIVHASINVELMPSEDREDIGSVTPSGWKGNNNRYDTDIVSGGYIYNRSHLIGFQLTGENDNERNLITGTRFFNVEGMLPFENQVADYVKEEPENHVLYRVTPIYSGSELVARGVLMEAYSIEDEGDGICFCVYVYNNQPGITINYATGENYLSSDPPPVTTAPITTAPPQTAEGTWILNTSKSSMKFHRSDCRYASSIKEENRQEYTGDRDYLINEMGYSPCGTCNP